MSEAVVNETCACGATFKYVGSSFVTIPAVEAWRADHQHPSDTLLVDMAKVNQPPRERVRVVMPRHRLAIRFRKPMRSGLVLPGTMTPGQARAWLGGRYLA